MDFADALHLAGSRACEGLVAFDGVLPGKAWRLALTPPVRLLA